MNTNLHLVFTGKCDEAFAYYEKVLNAKRLMTMKYSEAPQAAQVTPEMKDLVIHAAMRLGSMVLMGCDAPVHYDQAMGGFQISIEMEEEAEVKRVFAELSEGGSVQMPMGPTFWSPLFGMCTDKFGVAWMVGLPGQSPQ